MPNIHRTIDELGEMAGSPSDIGAEDTSNKGAASGYAALDADGNIDADQMDFILDLYDSAL